MPNVMAAHTNIGGVLCESSVIPFLAGPPRRKVWLTPTGRVSCSNAASMGERKTYYGCCWSYNVFNTCLLFSERELMFTFAICYRPTVCLSSVTFVRPTQAVQRFRQYFYGIRYLGHPLTSTENFKEIVPGEPPGRNKTPFLCPWGRVALSFGWVAQRNRTTASCGPFT